MNRENGRGNIRGFQGLSARETQLIILAGDGLTDKEIARELTISCGTVITLWSRVRAKLGINSRTAAVSVMSAVVARLNLRFPLFATESLGIEGLMGQLSGVRVLVNSKHVILSCSSGAESTLGTRPGLSLEGGFASDIRVTDLLGQKVRQEHLPWTRALKESQDVLHLDLTISRGSTDQRFYVDCHVIEDPILNRVAVVDFKPYGSSRRAEPSMALVREVALA